MGWFRRLIGLLLAVFLIGCTAAWISRDLYPPTWDDAYYLTRSLTQFDALVDHGVAWYAIYSLGILGPKAPLIALAPTPFYLLVGRHWHAAFAVNLLAMALLSGSVYSIARRLAGGTAGVLAIAICGSMPILYGLSRSFLVEFPLAALLAAAVALTLAILEDEQPDWRLVALGIVIGLGMLMKVTFLIYFAPVAIRGWVIRGPRFWRVAIVIAAVIALPWYLLHWRDGFLRAISAGYLAEGANYGGSLAAYLGKVTGAISKFYLWWLAAALLGIALKRSRRYWVLALWVLPFVLLAVATNKDVRFFAPLAPAVAVVIGCGLSLLVPKRAAAVLLLVPVIALASMLRNSFGLAGVGWAFEADCPYARAWDRRTWPNQHVIESVPDGARLLTATDTASFNADNLRLLVRSMRRRIDVVSSAYETEKAAALVSLDRASWFVYKEGGEPEASFFNTQRGALIVEASGRGFEEVEFPWASPDGGRVHLLRRRP